MDFRINGVVLGLQSWSIRNFKTIDEAADTLVSLGLDTLEICGVHADFNDEKSCAHVLEVCGRKGITLSCMGVEGFSAKNIANAENRFSFAKQAGMKYIAADPDADAETVDMLENLCEKYRIKLIVHNHGRNHRYGSCEQLDRLFSVYSKNVGLHMDAAWALDSGINPVEMADRYSDRIHGVHLKDFKYKPDGSFDECVLGEGDLDLPGLVKAIKRIPEFGVLSIEYEEHDPVDSIRKCIRNFVGQTVLDGLM